MTKSTGGAKRGSAAGVEQIAADVARELQMELVEVTLARESRGLCLCVYIDTDTGITLDDCERFHKRIQPLLENVDYDFLEVSSPGADRPIKTIRDFERNAGGQVEVRLFAPLDGCKAFRGALTALDGQTATILTDAGEKTFELKRVAVIKPVIETDEAAFEGLENDEGGEIL